MMDTMQWIFDQLIGRLITGSLIKIMENTFDDFAATRRQYHKTMDMLQAQLGESASPSVEEEKQAIGQQIFSEFFFSGILGIKANMDYFREPLARNFLETDPEAYLQERAAHRLPVYRAARNIRQKFYDALSPAQKEAYEDVTAYVSYLETAGPKIAHYFGYLLGNKLLVRMLPDYYPDLTQTIRYRAMLEEYFGTQLNRELIPPSEALQERISSAVDQVLSVLFSDK